MREDFKDYIQTIDTIKAPKITEQQIAIEMRRRNKQRVMLGVWVAIIVLAIVALCAFYMWLWQFFYLFIALFAMLSILPLVSLTCCIIWFVVKGDKIKNEYIL